MAHLNTFNPVNHPVATYKDSLGEHSISEGQLLMAFDPMTLAGDLEGSCLRYAQTHATHSNSNGEAHSTLSDFKFFGIRI